MVIPIVIIIVNYNFHDYTKIEIDYSFCTVLLDTFFYTKIETKIT
jgi:hypothetical protein